MSFFDQIALMWRQHREFRAALAELRRMTDRELTDLGIARCDVTRLAYEEAERRAAERIAATSARPHVAPATAPFGARHALS